MKEPYLDARGHPRWPCREPEHELVLLFEAGYRGQVNRACPIFVLAYKLETGGPWWYQHLFLSFRGGSREHLTGLRLDAKAFWRYLCRQRIIQRRDRSFSKIVG